MNRDALSPAPAVAPERMIASVRWAYRLVLGRDPESEKVLANWASLGDPRAVLRHLARSGEAAEVVATGRPLLGEWPAQPINAEAARAAWLLLHGVLPTAVEVEAILLVGVV